VLLKKRALLAHPHILKLIYFQTDQRSALCNYHCAYSTNFVYTEYFPITLQNLSPNQSSAPTLCSCLAVVSAVQSLQNSYGNFVLNKGMIFFEKDENKMGKVWIS